MEGTISWKSKFDTISTIIYIKEKRKRDKDRKDTKGENKVSFGKIFEKLRKVKKQIMEVILFYNYTLKDFYNL